MTAGTPQSFGAQLRSLREGAGYTQEELATIAGLSVHAVSALERGETPIFRNRARAVLGTGPCRCHPRGVRRQREAFVGNARRPADSTDELTAVPLPMPLTALLGRDADVETLRRWLADPASRLITLVGPGGVGKTRLALELARLMTAEGSARVTFVPLAYVRDASLAASAIAEALGLADVTGSELPRRARAACDGRSTLLVLDNFEQILDTAPLIADLLSSVAALRLLLAMPWGAGNALIGMSGIALEVDDDREAERLLDEATLLLGHAGPWFLARALFVRAIVAVRRAAADEALMWGRRSLGYISELDDKYAFVHAAVPLAAAAALKGDDLSAARVLGARDAVAERTGAEIVVKPVQQLRRQVERDTRERLGPERWGRAHAAGREISVESLLRDIDRISPVSSGAAGG